MFRVDDRDRGTNPRGGAGRGPLACLPIGFVLFRVDGPGRGFRPGRPGRQLAAAIARLPPAGVGPVAAPFHFRQHQPVVGLQPGRAVAKNIIDGAMGPSPAPAPQGRTLAMLAEQLGPGQQRQ